MGIRGPLVTLGAVGALAVGLWLGNVSHGQAPAPEPAANSAAASVTSAPAPTTSVPAPAFPARAEYLGTVPTKTGAIALEITVDGTTATAYACDNVRIESWLRGSAVNGALSMTSKDNTSRLEGRMHGAEVRGTLWIGDKQWQFEAARAPGDGDV